MFNPTMLSETEPQNPITKTNTMDSNFATTIAVLNDLKGELDAIIEYDKHINNSSNAVAITTWKHIRDEEIHHVGELLGLLNYLSPNFKMHSFAGKQEFENSLNSPPNYENM